jgi:methyl-accepting chemotaxis protein
MKIRTIAETAGILIVIGVLGASGAAHYAFQKFKVGGPVYSRIVLTKDLVSGILPPPEYIVEAYLEATLALNDPANAKEHAARISVLEKDYGERHRYWEASALEASLKQRLTRGAHQPAEEFWTLARQSFFPALERADIAAARDAHGRMTRAYIAHRAQIDNVVAEANRLNAATGQAAAAEESRIELKILVLLATVVSLILASAAGAVFCLSSRIVRLKSSIRAMADGNHGAEIPYCNASSEIGDIARAMQVLKGNLAENERLRVEKDEAGQVAATRRKAEMDALAQDFETAIGQVVESVATAADRLASAAATLTESATATEAYSQAVAQGSEQSREAVESVASASEELASTVSQIDRQVCDSNRITAKAIDQAGDANAHISHLKRAADQIGEVAELISSVAEQTNLLALNAAIEAARAGEAGKGFEAVAQEVKALAIKTAEATKGIGAEIGEMRGVIRESVSEVRNIGRTIGEISGVASSIAEAVTKQGVATREIAAKMHTAAERVSDIASCITAVTASAKDTGSASEHVLAAAQSLSKESDRLKSEAGNFLAGIRSAI